MTVKFNVVERGNPAKPEAPRKFYPAIQSSGRITVRQLAERAAQMSTLSTMDIVAAIESFLTIVPEELTNGKIVELGDFGNFWLRSTAEGVEEAAKVRGEQVTNLIPRFNPGKRFKRVLKSARFKKSPDRRTKTS